MVRSNEEMRLLFISAIFIFSSLSLAKDCSTVQPFKKIGSQIVQVSVARIFWTADGEDEEDVCAGNLDVPAYDVRGREDDAYYCLKPKESEVLSCKTTLDGEEADVFVVPASWIRKWDTKDVREFRFHSYVVKTNNSHFYFDIFSRNLTTELSNQELIVEGAIKTGPGNQSDGYFIRTKFKK